MTESNLQDRSKGDGNSEELAVDPKRVETRTQPGRSVDRLRRPVLNGLAVVGFVLPVALFFWLIHVDGVNMLRADQWDDIRLIQHSDSGTLSWGILWAQHNENRLFFQNLITLLLADTTNFNTLVEDYLSGALLVLATALLVVTHRRRAPSRPWIFYCPVVIVMLSVVVWGITLFGFEIGWSLIMLALAATLFLLDRPRVTGFVLAGAIAAAVVGSFSSLEGLIIWPAGLVLLCQRHRSSRVVLAWIVAALATAGLYFHNWTSQGNAFFSVFAHPIAGAKFFFFAIGDVVGIQTYTISSSDDVFVEIFGAVIVTFGLWAVITYGFRRDESSGRPLGVSLIWFGLLFAISITVGRWTDGVSGASASRYALFDLPILVGSYLVVIDRPEPALRFRRGRPVLPVMSAVVLATAFVQVVAGTSEGITNANGYRGFEIEGADVAANVDHAPDELVATVLGSGQTASNLRQMADFARAHRLSLFSTGAAAIYSKEGLDAVIPPVISVFHPIAGATLKGVQWLGASASDAYGVSKVEFDVTGNGMGLTRIGRAGPTYFGWLGRWNTTTVPNGNYTLRSVEYGATGLVTFSKGVVVHVKN